MTDLRPPPMVPIDCDLGDFQFMPLDVARLRDSGLASDESPEACWAAVLLWAASWHQVPASSIPNEDRWIAKAAGYVARGRIAKEWADVRPGALRNWVECSDGRLYHPVVAEKAREAWLSKLDQRWRSECARIKKHAQRHDMDLRAPSFAEWTEAGCPQGHRLPVPEDTAPCPRIVPRDKGSKGQGEGQGQGQGQGEVNPGGPSDLLSGSPPDADPRKPPGKVNGRPRTPASLDEAKESRLRSYRAQAVALLEFLNRRAGRAFQPVPANIDPIVSLLKSGSDPVQVRQVIVTRSRKWQGDAKMEEYLRPKTLFNRTNFANYVGELVDVPDDAGEGAVVAP